MQRLVASLRRNNPDVASEIAEYEKELRAAALLHDIGHYPLSHLGERVYMWVERWSRNEKDSESAESSPPQQAERWSLDRAARILAEKPDKTYRGHNHERLGAKLDRERTEVRQTLESHNIQPEVVAALIEGSAVDRGVPPYVAALMHSSIDADRLDYMQRDCAATGAVYGHVDSRYIAEMLRVRSAKETPDQKVLAFPTKAIRAADHYLLARFHFYSQVVYHKTVAAFSSVAAALMLDLVERGMLVYKHPDEITKDLNNDSLLRFHDGCFWRAVEESLDEGGYVGAWARTLWYRLRPELVYHSEGFCGPGNKCHAKEKSLGHGPDLVEARKHRDNLVGTYGPASVCLIEARIQLADIDPTARPVRDATADARMRPQLFEAVRVVSPEKPDVAECLVERPESLARMLADKTWARVAVFRLHSDVVSSATVARREAASAADTGSQSPPTAS